MLVNVGEYLIIQILKGNFDNKIISHFDRLLTDNFSNQSKIVRHNNKILLLNFQIALL